MTADKPTDDGVLKKQVATSFDAQAPQLDWCTEIRGACSDNEWEQQGLPEVSQPSEVKLTRAAAAGLNGAFVDPASLDERQPG